MSLIEAFIFDMDGLLLDSEIYWERARKEYCSSLGCPWTHDHELSAKGCNSLEWADLIRRACDIDRTPEQIVAGVSDGMRRLYDEHLPLLPGAVELVRRLAETYPLGLASSSPLSLIEFALEEAKIRGSFAVVVTSDEVGKGKPHPDVFLVTATRMGVETGQIAVFEDSSAGIEAACRAGMYVVAVPNVHYPPKPSILARADLVLGSLEDFRLDALN